MKQQTVWAKDAQSFSHRIDLLIEAGWFVVGLIIKEKENHYWALMEAK